MHFIIKLFIFIFLSSVTHCTSAQNLQFGGTLNIGKSRIFSKIPNTTTRKNEKFATSGNAGIFYEKRINTKYSWGIEALWVQIEGVRNFIVDENSIVTMFTASGPADFFNEESRYHYSYIGFPIYYKFHYNKLGIKAGIQPMLYLFGSSHASSIWEVNGQSYLSGTMERKDIERNNDIGPKFGVDYLLGNGYKLRFDYYHGLINSQVNLGIQINLGSN